TDQRNSKCPCLSIRHGNTKVEEQGMKSISIFGLGYVGATTAACLASSGYKVIAVDPARVKVDCINAGRSPVVEAHAQEMISKTSGSGLVSATHDAEHAIANSQISFICVGTPSHRNGRLDLTHIRTVCADIGRSLRSKQSFHWIVVRSTVLPGTTEG